MTDNFSLRYRAQMNKIKRQTRHLILKLASQIEHALFEKLNTYLLHLNLYNQYKCVWLNHHTHIFLNYWIAFFFSPSMKITVEAEDSFVFKRRFKPFTLDKLFFVTLHGNNWFLLQSNSNLINRLTVMTKLINNYYLVT